MNPSHVVPTANGEYSECVDDLVALSSATLLAMNDRIASPRRRSFTPPGRKGLPLPVGLLVQLDTLAVPLEYQRREAAALASSRKPLIHALTARLA